MKTFLPFWIRLIAGASIILVWLGYVLILMTRGDGFGSFSGFPLLTGALLIESALQELRIEALEKAVRPVPPTPEAPPDELPDE